MEIRVESANADMLPKGAYVSVRVGDVLKQGKYEPQRCYNFPAIDRRRDARIDVYQHVGTCLVAVDPDSKATHEVYSTSTDPSFPPAKLKVNVSTRSQEVGEKRAERGKALKGKAKDYLWAHKVEERLSEAVKALLKAQPLDPFDFLCRYLAEKSGHAFTPSTDTKPSQLAPLAQKPLAQKPQAQPKQDQAALRKQAAEMLFKANDDGSLSKALEEVKGAPKAKDVPTASPGSQARGKELDEFRLKASNALMSAVQTGELDKALHEIKQAARPGPGTSRKDIDATRENVSQVLMEAAANGDLEKALSEIARENKSGSGAAVSEQQLSKERADAVRQKAANVLMQAAETGELEKALLEVKQDSQKPAAGTKPKQGVEDIRKKASNILIQASGNGELEKALQEIKQQAGVSNTKPEMDAVRMKAASALMLAADNGDLEKALREIQQEAQKPAGGERDMDTVRTNAANTLMTAAGNGDLEKVLREFTPAGPANTAAVK